MGEKRGKSKTGLRGIKFRKVKGKRKRRKGVCSSTQTYEILPEATVPHRERLSLY